MASSPPPNFSPSLLLLLLLFLLPPSLAGGLTETHLHFFFHDIPSGPSATAVRVAQAPTTNTSATAFGAVVVFDDPLTEGPNLTSKPVGRAQGMYAFDSLEESGHLLLSMNLVFSDGAFNGSTLAVLGRNSVMDKVREFPVIGGSGTFRLAQGYVLASTNTFDPTTGYTVVEYNVTVMHN